MNRDEDIYTKLRNLYSGKDASYGSLRKGKEIEELVNSLIKDIVTPFDQKLRVRLGKHEFDGEVVLGRGYTLLYEVFGGSLSRFRFDNLFDVARNTYFPRRRTYLLTMARAFSKRDRERIHILNEKMLTTKVKLCFMDCEVLISLHRFSSYIQADNAEKGLKTMKRLFLSKLFESTTIINRKFFQSALSFAKNRYPFEIMEPAHAYARAGIGFEIEPTYTLLEDRLAALEKLILEALEEIRQLRRGMHKSRRD